MMMHDVCGECTARCCRKSGLGFTHLILSYGEARMPLFKHKAVLQVDTGSYALYFEKGRCPFLGKDNRCSIYEQRPDTCRSYVCWDMDELRRSDGFAHETTHRRLMRRWKLMPGQINESQGINNKT